MAIVINSLTPVNPVAIVGSSVTFEVNAFDTNGENLTYEWQYSTDGILYTPIGLFDNTSAIYTTSNLSISQDGLYFRVRVENESNEVVFSNDLPNIGDRIIDVIQAPLIEVLSVNYEPTYYVTEGQTITLSISVSLANVDITTTTFVSNIGIVWQESRNNGSTWSTISSGTFNGYTYSIGESVEAVTTNPVTYAKNSSLALVNLTASSNQFRYRAIVSYTGASNSPVALSESILLINPEITIIRQPGVGTLDTKLPVQCYKTGISGSGNIYVSLSAISTANTSLAYAWEYNLVDDGGNQTGWTPIAEGLAAYQFVLRAGTSSTTDILDLQRVIYFDQIGFRCTITGQVGENPLISNEYYIRMRDVVTSPSNIPTTLTSLEDYYGPIENRNLFTLYPVRNLRYESTLNKARNTGLNGTIRAQYQRKASGSSTWENVGSEIVSTYNLNENYTLFPVNTTDLIDVNYETPALRFDTDNQSQYRIKVTASSVYTLSGNTKTLTEFYSNISTITIYREVFILTQPTSTNSFKNQSTSFSVNAVPSSGSTISYQWQYNTANVSTGWINITNSSPYSGANTSILVINPVTDAIGNLFYRCVLDVPNSTQSYISTVATTRVLEDFVGVITSLNDISINEFQPASWTVTAQSLSLSSVQYQWQKSTNFLSSSPSTATWTDIPGQTSNTFTIASASFATDTGHYRVKVTSAGGTISFSNVAKLTINRIAIQINENLPSTLSFLEGLEDERTLTVSATSTIGEIVSYQWQIKKTSDPDFVDFGIGFNGSLPNLSSYTPRAFDPVTDNNAIIRCEITAASIPTPVYSTQCTITVNRRFSYFADSATKLVSLGGNFSLDLFPTVTGGTPSYQWQQSTNNGTSWSNITGETSSTLFIPNVTNLMNNYLYRCQVTLSNCTQYQYSRNNIITLSSASPVDFTQSVKLSVSAVQLEPRYYSKETEKLGAAIGTVICVPKPASYINDPSATTDDISQWKVSVTGNITTSSGTSSVVTSGSIYNANKPSWADNTYISPKWLLTDDRFPGFIELRGQWIRKDEFPILYQVIGDSYGSTSTLFKLPNPYGKKIMGTGDVDNNGGGVSVDPVFDADGNSGGDKNLPGSIGGVWVYKKSRQLPQSAAIPDGTAGTEDPATLSLGSFRTDNFTACEGIANTSFSGSFEFTVGPLFETPLQTPPPHTHSAISAGAIEGFRARAADCSGRPILNPAGPFYAIAGDAGEIFNGPEGISESERGRTHSHSLSDNPQSAGNSTRNHETGIGDTPGLASVTKVVDLDYRVGSTRPSANMFLEPVTITLTNATRTVFDSSVAFYLKNNEDLPLVSNYFRVKYMIKAY